MKKVIALALILMLGVAILAGCGDSLSGKYVLVSASNGSETKTGDDLKGEFEDNLPYIEFNGGNYKALSEYGSSFEGTFTVDGKDITLNAPEGEEDVLKGTIDGKKITFTNNGFTMIYEKK